MNPTSLIPTPDSVPVPVTWFQVLLLVTFLIHILLMNIMMGGGMIAVVNGLFGISRETDSLTRDVSVKLPFTIALAINFGVAPLLFLQVLYGNFFYVSSILMGVFWLSIILFLIAAYYGAYFFKFRFDTLKNKRTIVIGIVVLLFMLIAFFLTNNMTLMINPSSWTRYFKNPEGTILNLSDPTLVPRYLHFIFGSAAIGGLFIATVWTFKQKSGNPDAKRNIETGMKWFTHATLLQIPIGTWFLFSIPAEIRHTFMGGHPVHSAIFLISLILIFFSLLSGFLKKTGATVFFTVLLTFFMVIMRDILRNVTIKPFFTLSDIPVTGQYSSLVVFLVAFLIGFGVIAYLIRMALSARFNS